MTVSGQKALAYVKKLGRTVAVYSKGVYHRFYTDTVFVWSGAIAFKVLITFVPLIVLATGLLGLVLRQDAPFGTVTQFLESFLPEYESAQVIQIVRSLAEAGQTITIIGGLGLIVAVVTLFSTLRVVVASVFKRQSHSRSIIHAKLFDLRMAAQVGVLFLLSIGLTLFMRSITPRGAALLHGLAMNLMWLEEGWRNAIQILGWLFPLIFTTLMFVQFYYFIPIPRPTLRGSWTGAIIAGILWELLKIGFTYLATVVGYTEQYRGAVGQVGVAFGLAVAILLWVYYSGAVLIIGAEVAAIYEERHLKSPRRPGIAAHIHTSPGTSSDQDRSAKESTKNAPLQ